MFGGSRRRRPRTAVPLNSATANPSATTAAASAFMSAASQNPNRALSSAAAAAALRARPHTPTNVAEVQTKRTMRRSASVSSSGSAPNGARLGNARVPLERRGNTASMTERTFRSPSPHRSSTPTAREPQPPVPQIPDSHKNSATSSRATGAGMQNFRTASQKMGKEHSSWHVRPAGDVSNVRTSDAIMTPPKSQPSRPDSRNSVNFSYPTVFRPQSPPASPTSSSMSHFKVASPRPSIATSSSSRGLPSNSHTQGSQKLVYDPNSRRIIPEPQIEEAVEYRTRQAAGKPAKKRRDGTLRKEGIHLAKGTMTRAKGTTVDESNNPREPPEGEQPALGSTVPAGEMLLQEGPGTKAVITTESLNPDKPAQSPEPSGSVFESPPPLTHKGYSEKAGDHQPSHSVQTAATTIQDEATVKEEQPRMEDRSQSSRSVLGALDAVPTRQSLFKSPQPQQSSQKQDNHGTAQDYRSPSAVERSELTETGSEQRVVIPENKPVVVLAAENGGVSRSSSSSPARQARFAPKPAEKLAVRHDPLPRSASPIKSAMKHTNPIARETSPSDNVSDPSVSSAVSPDQKEESATSRKKSVRVSFDDHGTVIVEDSPSAAEEESPATQSPQAPKRTWFSNIGRSKKKEIALDDDEIMKPRPALPSFGSIRDKKTREQWERPLVRPHEPIQSSMVSSSPELRPQSSSTLNDSETTEEPQLGQSSDHAIGALLTQDQTSRIAANISRFREPLPPVVTSIEGYGYSSDSSQGSDNEEHPDGSTEAGLSTMNSSVLGTQLTQPDIDDGPENESTAVSNSLESPQTAAAKQQDIPEISVIQPSPMPLEHSPSSDGVLTSDYFDVPGGFPEVDFDSNGDSALNPTKDNTVKDSVPSSTAIFKPTLINIEPGQAEILPQTTLDTITPLTGPDDIVKDDTDDSIYSDAYEDIPDIDSSGFMSLDAIVESPTTEEPTPTLLRSSESSPTAAITSERKQDAISGYPSVRQAQSILPQDMNEWEQAKIFWRSLTAEKRRQLELEVAEEAGADGDREEVSQPVRRSSTRKKSPELAQSSAQTVLSQGGIVQPESHTQMSGRDAQTAKPSAIQPQTGMRRTLRSNGGAQSVVKPSTRQAITMQTQSPTPLVASRNQITKPRPHSSALPTSRSRPSAQAKPPLQRRGSDASDSSFKRNRHSSIGNSAFRKTMRQTSPIQPQHDSSKGSGRFSLRSLSPVGSTVHHEPNTGLATSSAHGMRRTLRSTSESNYEGKRSSIHFPLFTRSTKSPPKSSKWNSRLGDSSDEDEGASISFRSRIQDSSDEDENRPNSSMGSKPSRKTALHSSTTTTSHPSRPAPVPELEEDSPDLPDSDDDFMPSPLQSVRGRTTSGDFASRPTMGRSGSGAIGTSTLGQSRSGRGGLPPVPTSPALPPKERRSSLLSILRRNMRADQSGKIQRSEPVDSAARRDTKLERDMRQLKDLRSEQPPPSSPKLQKRILSSTTGSRGDSGGPALASHLLLGRSATAERPALSDRRSFSLGTYPQQQNDDTHEFENASVDGAGLPKKKKFGALRRMFKLDE